MCLDNLYLKLNLELVSTMLFDKLFHASIIQSKQFFYENNV